MKRIAVALLLVSLLLLGGRALVGRAMIHSLGDAFDYAVFGWDEATRYPPAYTESAFSRLKVGMAADDVERTLGRPLKTWRDESDGCQVLYFSLPVQAEGTYWLRHVVIDSLGRVVDVRRQLFFD